MSCAGPSVVGGMVGAVRSVGTALATALVIALACAASAPPAHAQGATGCPGALERWAEACDAGPEPVRLVSCPAGHAIVMAGPGRLRVDVTRTPEGAFATAGPLGLSPVGQFPSWESVPRADRDAFAAIVRCAEESHEPFVEALARDPRSPSGSRSDRPAAAAPLLPWRLVLGVLVALALVGRRIGARELARRALPVLGVAAATFVARRVLVPESYFHQNGQGPFWIAHALGEPSSYGPGYAQVFYWAASRAGRDPDGAVFLVQAALAATVPASAFVIARAVSRDRAFAWAAAIAIALAPILARLAHTESYFATTGALLAVAAAILALGMRPDASASSNVTGALAAGLVVAQAALVHPSCWLAAALLPGVVLVGPGSLRERARLAAIATAVIGASVLVTAGADLLAVLQGPVGADWLSPERHGRPRGLPPALVTSVGGALVAALALARAPARRSAALGSALLAVVSVVGWRGNLLGPSPPWIHHAYGWLYLGPALAGVAAIARELHARHRPGWDRARWVLGATLLALVLAWHGATWAETTELPTDTREAVLFRAWREHLPEQAVVTHLERAEDHIVALPLYGPGHVRLRTGEAAADLTAVGRDVLWYRSSACSTEQGRGLCDDIERAYELEPIQRATLPAIRSMGHLEYDRDQVEVVLFRVRDRRRSETSRP